MRLFLALCVGLVLDAAPAPPPARKCALRIAWWSNPAEQVELAVVQGQEIVPWTVLEMNLDLAQAYQGAAELKIVRRKGPARQAEPFDPDKLHGRGTVAATPPEPANKPAPRRKENPRDWDPFVSIPLPASSDVGVLLMMTPEGTGVGRAFDHDLARFPYGSIHLVNLSSATLAGELDSKGFQLAPGGSGLLPVVFRERRSSHVKLAALLPDQSWETILETKIAGRPNRRSLVFILQSGISPTGVPRFESRSIESLEAVAPEPAAGLPRPKEAASVPMRRPAGG